MKGNGRGLFVADVLGRMVLFSLCCDEEVGDGDRERNRPSRASRAKKKQGVRLTLQSDCIANRQPDFQTARSQRQLLSYSTAQTACDAHRSPRQTVQTLQTPKYRENKSYRKKKKRSRSFMVEWWCQL